MMKKEVFRIGKYLPLLLFFFFSCNKEEIQPERKPGQYPISEFLSTPVTIEVNPSGAAPLTALVTFITNEPCQIALSVEGNTPLAATFQGYETDHQIPVLGLYPVRANKVVLTITARNGAYAVDTLTVTPEDLPEGLPEIEILAAQPALMEPGWHLAELHLARDGKFLSCPIIFDHEGTIRWALVLEAYSSICWPIQRLENGNLFFGTGSSLYEYDLLGRLLNHWDFPGYGFHHDVIELPTGNFAAAVNKNGSTVTIGSETMPSFEDHLIEIDRISGAVVQEWDLRPLLDVSRTDLVDGGGDWFHMNAVIYSEADDSFILSGRNQGVVKISRTNQLKWILAPHRGWGPSGADGEGFETSSYLLTAVDASGTPLPPTVQQGEGQSPDFDWPWGQHAPLLLSNGHLFLFDNGFNRNFNPNAAGFSRGVEYRIDEETMTVQQLWEYGSLRSAELFAPIISDVDCLPVTGNRLMVPGIIDPGSADPSARIIEVTYPGGEVVFEAVLRLKNAGGNGEFAWGQFDIVYRGERMKLEWIGE